MRSSVPAHREDDLSEHSTFAEVPEGLRGLVKGVGGINHRMQVGQLDEPEQAPEILQGAHGVAVDADVLEEDPGQFGTRLVS